MNEYLSETSELLKKREELIKELEKLKWEEWDAHVRVEQIKKLIETIEQKLSE